MDGPPARCSGVLISEVSFSLERGSTEHSMESSGVLPVRVGRGIGSTK